MTVRRNDFGISSMVFGAISIIAALVVRHAKASWNPGEAHFISWMDRHGLVGTSSASIPELRASGLITFTDESVLLMLLCFGLYLGAVSMFFSLWAERRGEENLYLSAGFILGALGLALVSFPFGVVAMVVGAFVVHKLRKRQRGGVAQ